MFHVMSLLLYHSQKSKAQQQADENYMFRVLDLNLGLPNHDS